MDGSAKPPEFRTLGKQRSDMARDDADARLTARNPPAPPFDNTRDTRYFFPSAGHAEALSRLQFLAEDRNMGLGLLTGEIGSGKTLLRTLLHARLSPETHVRVSIENGLLGFDDLLLEMLRRCIESSA